MGDALFDHETELLPSDWELPQEIRARVGGTVGRQRAMLAGGHLLVILHHVPAPDEDTRRGAIAWRDPAGRWKSPGRKDGLAALRDLIEEYETTVSNLDDAVESNSQIDGFFVILEKLAPITRAARHMHATLQQARDACPGDRAIIDLRDRAYEIERRSELLSVDARFGLDRALARSSHEHTLASRRGAEATDRLNRMAALFLPLATTAALLGMNVKTGLEDLPAPLPFVLILGLGVLAGVWLRGQIHRP